MEILVVDDSRMLREMVVAALRGDPSRTFTHAESGLEAIERLTLTAFHLVVLDLNMPDIGGIEVLEFVRAQDNLRQLPIVVVTSRSDDRSRQEALAAGASAFVTKPFTPENLEAEVSKLLSGAGARSEPA